MIKFIFFSVLFHFSLFLCSCHKYGTSIIEAHVTHSQMYSDIKISFGSMYNPRGPQNPNIFRKIADAKPDMFIWLGEPLHLEEESDDYDHELFKLKRDHEYMRLESTAKVTGVTDVFGDDVAKHKLFSFLDEELTSERRFHSELYRSFWIKSNPGFKELKPMFVKVLLLDLSPEYEGHLSITENEAEWLRMQLQEEKENHFLTVIASVYPILPENIINYGTVDVSTKLRLLKLFQSSDVPLVLISGNYMYSFGEIMRYPCSDQELGYPLYEISSAGLNINSFPMYKELNRFIDPPTFSNYSDRTFQPNYGEMTIRYNYNKPETSELYLELKGKTEKILVSKAPYVPQIPNGRARLMRDMVCARELYSDDTIVLNLMNNIRNLFQDPQFLKRYLPVLGLAFALFSSISVALCLAFTRSKKNSFTQYDEYEKYHME